MKTKERILQASLALFNEYGVAKISTNHIALEMDISPGNLYYHFRNKDEIINILFQRFESQILEILEPPQHRAPNMEDLWFYLHLVFEHIWHYRFLYRNLDDLLRRDKKWRTHFRRIIERKIQTARGLCQGLVQEGVMTASSEEIMALANNIATVATYWLNFQSIRHQDDEQTQLGLGVYQVMALVTPFLQGEARALLHRLSQDYLD